jgi:hypothetical protein
LIAVVPKTRHAFIMPEELPIETLCPLLFVQWWFFAQRREKVQSKRLTPSSSPPGAPR